MNENIIVLIVAILVPVIMVAVPHLFLRTVAHLESEAHARARFARHFGRHEWVHITAARVRLSPEEMGKIALHHGYVYATSRQRLAPIRQLTFARVYETPGVTLAPTPDEERVYHQIFQSGKFSVRTEPRRTATQNQFPHPPVARICTIAARYGLIFNGARNRPLFTMEPFFTRMDSSLDLTLPGTYLGEFRRHWSDRRKSKMMREIVSS